LLFHQTTLAILYVDEFLLALLVFKEVSAGLVIFFEEHAHGWSTLPFFVVVKVGPDFTDSYTHHLLFL
jgi:hypothetical protein